MSRSVPPRRTPRLRLEKLEERTTPSVAYALNGNNGLFRFDTARPGTIQSAVTVTGLLSGESLVSLDFRPATGQLYALGRTGHVYVVNPLTGAGKVTVTNNGPPLEGTSFGFDFDPTVDRMRVVSDTGQNLLLEPVGGGVVNFDDDLTPAGNVVSIAHDQNFNGTPTTTVFGIDATADALVRIGGVNGNPVPGAGAVTTVGALGVDTTAAVGFDVAPGGANAAFATLRVNGVTGLFSINLATGAATRIGSIGDGTPQFRGLAIVPDGVRVAGSGPGKVAEVKVFDAQTGALKFDLQPFGNFTGGVRVASGDVNRDGTPDVIVAPGPSGGPRVRVFNGVTGLPLPGILGSFFAYTPNFAGGVYVGSGDVNGDGFDDVITGAGKGGGPHVRVFSGLDGSSIRSFFAFAPTFTGGVTVASLDINFDGQADIMTGTGPGGVPRVRIYNGALNGVLLSGYDFVPFQSNFRGGVFVAAGEVDGDGIPDFVASSGPGGPSAVVAFSGATGKFIANFGPYAATFTGGTTVGLADVNGDGLLDFLTGPGTGKSVFGPQIRAFTPGGKALLGQTVFDPTFMGGVYVAGARN